MTSLDNITIVLFPPPPAQYHPWPWWMNSDTPKAPRARRITAIGDTVWTVVFPAQASHAKTPFNAIARTMGIVAG